MIALSDVSKTYHAHGVASVVADRISAVFPSGRAVALLGANGAGKSSLLRLISGAVHPDRGRILRRGRVSWPVGFSGSFHPDLTGRENTAFVARLYGADPRGTLDFVADFAQLGAHFDAPLRGYSAGMRARLAFGLSMALPFDTYLIDEVTAVGDGAFREASEDLLRARLDHAGAIVVSHSLKQLALMCQSGAVLDRGRLTWHEDVMDAIAHHRRLMGIAA